MGFNMTNGGIIGPKNNTSNTSASGVFSISEQQGLKKNDIWPNPILLSTNVFNLVGDPLDCYNWFNQFTPYRCTISRDTTVTDSPYGGVPLKMVVTGTDPVTGGYNASSTNISSASANQTWTLKALVKANINTAGEFFVFGANSAGTAYVNNSWISLHNYQFSISTQWQEFSYTFTLSDNADISYIQFRLDGPNAGTSSSIWWDGIQLYKNS